MLLSNDDEFMFMAVVEHFSLESYVSLREGTGGTGNDLLCGHLENRWSRDSLV